MKLTQSQIKAIKQQKHIFIKIHPSATFQIWQPKNTNIIRLTAEHKMASAYGGYLTVSTSWSIGKRGKVSQYSVFSKVLDNDHR